MKNLIVVLMGGLSGERKISFLTGEACFHALKKKGYKVKKIDAKGYFINKLKKLKPKIVVNALHGRYGEDGFVQIMLESPSDKRHWLAKYTNHIEELRLAYTSCSPAFRKHI